MSLSTNLCGRIVRPLDDAHWESGHVVAVEAQADLPELQIWIQPDEESQLVCLPCSKVEFGPYPKEWPRVWTDDHKTSTPQPIEER